MAFAFPPVCPAFLRLFGAVDTSSVIWDNPSCGTFGVVVRRSPPSPANGMEFGSFNIPSSPIPLPAIALRTLEVESDLKIPEIGADRRSQEPPLCAHGRPTLRRTMSKKDSPNLGRVFYVCPFDSVRRCPFFRWADDVENFSTVQMRPIMTAADVLRETGNVDPEVQLTAWTGTDQGTEAWHRLRA